MGLTKEDFCHLSGIESEQEYEQVVKKYEIKFTELGKVDCKASLKYFRK